MIFLMRAALASLDLIRTPICFRVLAGGFSFLCTREVYSKKMENHHFLPDSPPRVCSAFNMQWTRCTEQAKVFTIFRAGCEKTYEEHRRGISAFLQVSQIPYSLNPYSLCGSSRRFCLRPEHVCKL